MRIFNQFDYAFDPMFIFSPSDLKVPFDFLKKIKMIPSRYGAYVPAKALSYQDLNEFEHLLYNSDFTQYFECTECARSCANTSTDEFHKLCNQAEFPSYFDIDDFTKRVLVLIEHAAVRNRTTSFDKLFGTEELVDKNLNKQLNWLSTDDDYRDDNCDYNYDDNNDDKILSWGEAPIPLDFCAVNGAINGGPNKLQNLKGMNIGLNTHDIIRFRHITDNEMAFATSPFLLKKKYLVHDDRGYVLSDSFNRYTICTVSFKDIIKYDHDADNDPDNECHYGFEGHMGDLISKAFTEEEQKGLSFMNVANAYKNHAEFIEENRNGIVESGRIDDKQNIVSIQISNKSNITKMSDREYAKLVSKVTKFMHEIAYATDLSSIGINSKGISSDRPFAMFSYSKSIADGYRLDHDN